jgi:hypothetical protein
VAKLMRKLKHGEQLMLAGEPREDDRSGSMQLLCNTGVVALRVSQWNVQCAPTPARSIRLISAMRRLRRHLSSHHGLALPQLRVPRQQESRLQRSHRLGHHRAAELIHAHGAVAAAGFWRRGGRRAGRMRGDRTTPCWTGCTETISWACRPSCAW